MKTKRRTLIVLLVFVLAAGAALALLTHANQKAEQAASEAEDGSIPLLDGTAATLESVSIQYGGETLTLRPSDDGWTLTEDPAYHLDDSACSTIRTALAGTKAKRQLEAQPGEDYGFDAPQLVVNVSAAGESTTLTVGAENPVTGDVYVRREGGDAVYTVDAARFRCMEQTKAELFGAFSPAGITVSDIEAVRYTLQSGETIKLQSVSQPTEADSTTYQTVWQLTDEPDDALDTDKTDALLAALASYVTGQDTAADLSACGFDLLLCGSRESSCLNGQLLGQRAGAEDLNAVESILNDAGIAEDLCSYLSAVFKLLQCGNIDRCVSGAENVVETTLRQTTCQRHLAAFKARTDTAAGTGPLALVTATCGLAIAGTSAAALTVCRLGSACGRRQFMQLHGLRLLYDFEQVTDLLYLAARLRVVRLNGYVIDLLKPQRMSRCDVLLQATSQALFQGNLHVSHYQLPLSYSSSTALPRTAAT